MAALEHRHLRSALEFAVLMASEGQKRKPPMAFPKELKAHFNKPRVASGALGRLRRAIDEDPVFRERIAAGALPELVDEIGREWLERRDGWHERALELAAALDATAEAGDLATRLRRAEKRRDAAEQAAARTRAELLHRDEFIAMQTAEIDDLRAQVSKSADLLAETKTEMSDIRMEIRHARDRESAAVAKVEAAEQQLYEARAADDEARAADDEATVAAVDPAERNDSAVPAISAEVSAAAQAARRLAEQLEALLPHSAGDVGASSTRPRPARRVPITLPGGVISTSGEAAEFLARSDATFVVDGYNVAKLGWPNHALQHQREIFLDAVENLARRFGTDVTVIFDGASVVGAHASRRRLVRVMFSPDGTTADDVIRDEVRRIPSSHPVVVVTNDGAIVRDVRADGANVVPSNALLAVL